MSEETELRDLFAASALQGLIANGEGISQGAEPTVSALLSTASGAYMRQRYALLAYELADAMLAARQA